MDQPRIVTENRTQDTEVWTFKYLIKKINTTKKLMMAGQIRKSLYNNEIKKDAQVETMVEITMEIAIISILVTKNTD